MFIQYIGWPPMVKFLNSPNSFQHINEIILYKVKCSRSVRNQESSKYMFTSLFPNILYALFFALVVKHVPLNI